MNTHAAQQPDHTVAEIAAVLQCSEKKVRRLAKAGVIPAYRLGRDWRFRSNALEVMRQRQAHRPDDGTNTQPIERAARTKGGRLKGWNKFA